MKTSSIKKITRFVLLVSGVFFAVQAVGQSRHWRLGIAYQSGPSLGTFTQQIVSYGQGITFGVETARAIMLTAERPLNNWLRLNMGLGQVRQDININGTIRYPLNNAGLVASGGASVRSSVPPYLFGALGLTVNTRTWGPFTLLAGFDVLARHVPTAPQNLLTSSGTTTVYLTQEAVQKDKSLWVEGVDVIRYKQSAYYRRYPPVALTLAVSPRVGVDMQIVDRFSVYVGAVATLGLGPVVQGRAEVDLNGRQMLTDFEHRGSFWGLQVGAKYHLWRGRSTKGLHF